MNDPLAVGARQTGAVRERGSLSNSAALPSHCAGEAPAASFARFRQHLLKARRWSVVTVVAQTTATLAALVLFDQRDAAVDGLMFIPFAAGLLVVGGLVQFRRSVQRATREGMTSAASKATWLWGALSAMPGLAPFVEVKLLTDAARAVERDTGAVDVLPRVRRLALARLLCRFAGWPLMGFLVWGGSSMLVGGLLGLPTLVCLALAMRATTTALEDAAAVDVSALAATGARAPVAFATLPAANARSSERVPNAHDADLHARDRVAARADRPDLKQEQQDDT